LTHQGADEDSLLATQLTGLDVIVGGHSHTRIQTPQVVNNIIIAQAGANCENLGMA
jgi:2',3'-cyclic-nucleotide 2'-phosphodiesterase (5'-nucleotidase family)